MDRRLPSMAGRALLAVCLMIGFYLIAMGIAVALLSVPYVAAVAGLRIPGQFALFCIVSAVVILWSILPRPDRFAPPGPVLSPQEQPLLFQVVREIANATRQAMPVEIYLIPDVNAWVTQRGGIMAFGSRRVMGLGLPLLQVLKVPELRAVLAHEFGHYHGGDTMLGPWVYKTRCAIERTLTGLSGRSRLLQIPFIGYAELFLRVSHDVSRRQEFAADALAAHIVGAGPLIDGLKTIPRAAVAFAWYWSREVEPVLRAGFLPPLADGFVRFIHSQAIASTAAEAADRAMRESRAGPYDTHPPLRERVEALRALPRGESPPDDLPAITLLARLPVLERDVIVTMIQAQAHALMPVSWEEVRSRVFLPEWEGVVQRHREYFAGLTIDALPEKARTLVESLANTHEAEWQAGGSKETRWRRGVWMLGAVLAATLARAGWTVRTQPGEDVLLQGPSDVVEPFALADSLVSGEMNSADWRRRCGQDGIAGLRLTA